MLQRIEGKETGKTARGTGGGKKTQNGLGLHEGQGRRLLRRELPRMRCFERLSKLRAENLARRLSGTAESGAMG